MASQQNKQAETSQKKAQTSYQRMTLFIQQVEKEGPNLRRLTFVCTTCGSHVSLKCSCTAQERLKGLEAKVENGLTTVDKASKVELMKLPPSLRNAKIGGLMSGGFPTFLSLLCGLSLLFMVVFTEEDVSSSDVSIALKVSVVWSFFRPLTAGFE